MQLAVAVENRGRYTITRIEARISPDGKSLVAAHPKEIPGSQEIPGKELWAAYLGVLTPWDSYIEFQTDDLPISGVTSFFPVVRWTDRWGTCWEHKRGEVREVMDGRPWVP